MHFPVKDLQEVMASGFKDDDTTRRRLCERFPDLRDKGPTQSALIAYLHDLPSSVEQNKILAKIEELAKETKFTSSDFRWWFCGKGSHWLLFKIHRDEHVIEMCLIWKQVRKGSSLNSLLDEREKGRWAVDKGPNNEKGWRFQIETSEYHRTIQIFEQWLNRPLPLYPDEEKQITSPRSFIGK